MTGPSIGDPAPDFEIPDQDGRMVKLSGLRGKPVVVFVYPQDGTQTCTAEAVSFSALAAKFRGAGARLFGLSPDSPEKHRKFRDKHDLAMPLLSDTGRAVIEPWGCWGDKVMFGRHYKGVIRSTFLIDAEGKLAGVWRGVRVAGHAQAVLDAVKAMKAGTNAPA